MSSVLKTEFPFAQYRFMTDGTQLFAEYQEKGGIRDASRLIALNRKGQLAWTEIIKQTLTEFSYEDSGIVIRWNLGGADSGIYIDPRIAFGAPVSSGIPTWVLKERWNVGESVKDLAEDFSIDFQDVVNGLRFENIEPDFSRESVWAK